MADLSDTFAAAVEAAHDVSFGGEQANRHHIRMMLAAALPVLNTAKDTETTALREEAGKREALMEMVAHRDTKIDDLRRECDSLLTRLNEAHATNERLASEQAASRNGETAEPELVMGTKPDGSPWVISAEFARSDVRVDGHRALRLHGKAIAPSAAHKLATGLLAAIAWLGNDGAAKAEAAASLRGKQP